MNTEIYDSIYSGNVWKDFQQFNNETRLSEPNSYGLMLNIDWFCSFKHGRYKIGAIYMCLMNLPREIRFKPESIILVGLIPGPTEPKVTVDTFLRPLLDELLDFWKGITIPIGEERVLEKVRCALLCVSCNLPAGRKICGFFSYSATLGCSYCMKKFPGQAGNKDYSGFDRTLWQPCTLHRMKECLSEIQFGNQSTKRKELVSKYGCRLSELHRLPYFNPIQMLVIDPMHWLYLGIAKHILQRVWIEKEVIPRVKYSLIHQHLNAVQCPSHVGRMPNNVFYCFGGYTADQYKNWVNIFSLFALQGILSGPHWECWKHFVLAS